MPNRGSAKPFQKITASFEKISYIDKFPIETVIRTYSLWKSYKMKLIEGEVMYFERDENGYYSRTPWGTRSYLPDPRYVLDFDFWDYLFLFIDLLFYIASAAFFIWVVFFL